MTTANQRHQSGYATAYIKDELWSPGKDLYVTTGEGRYIVTFTEGGTLTMKPMDQGVAFDSREAFISWAPEMEDTIIDIFKAIGKALDIYSDEPGQAYKQGYAEGQAAVLREWNNVLRGVEPGKPEAAVDYTPPESELWEQMKLFQAQPMNEWKHFNLPPPTPTNWWTTGSKTMYDSVYKAVKNNPNITDPTT